MQACGFRVLVTQLTPTSVPIHDIDFTQPTAFILGNEVNGECRMSKHHSADIYQSATWYHAQLCGNPMLSHCSCTKVSDPSLKVPDMEPWHRTYSMGSTDICKMQGLPMTLRRAIQGRQKKQ